MEQDVARNAQPVRTYTVLQAHFLRRLRDLKAKLDAVDPVAAEPWVQRLLRRAIYTTLHDCIAVGVGDEARAIIQPDGTRAIPP